MRRLGDGSQHIIGVNAPPGPRPTIWRSSIPCCHASDLALGVAITVPISVVGRRSSVIPGL